MASLIGLGVAAIFLYTILSVTPVMPFLYANAVLAARSKFLLSDAKCRALAELSSLHELITALVENDYDLDTEKSASLQMLNIGLEKNLISLVLELRKLSTSKLEGIFDAYLMFYEAKPLKLFYRKLFLKLSQLDDKLVYEVGTINHGMLMKLKEAHTLADTQVILAPTIYHEVFSKEYGSIEEFEISLDSFILSEMVLAVQSAKMFEAKVITDLLLARQDIFNMITIIKSMIRGVPNKGKIMLVKTDTLIYQTLLKSNTATLQEFVESFAGKPYHSSLQVGLEQFSKDGSIYQFEKALWSHFKVKLIDEELKHPQGPYPIMAYLMRKEIEYKNLLIVAKSIEGNFPKERTEGLLIV